MHGWGKIGVGLLKFCQRGQGWWRAQDWTNCMIGKRDGSGGGREKGERCQKNVFSYEKQSKR